MSAGEAEVPAAVFVGGPYDGQVRQQEHHERNVRVMQFPSFPRAEAILGERDVFTAAMQPLEYEVETYTAQRIAPFATHDLPMNSWRTWWRRVHPNRWEDPSGHVRLVADPNVPEGIVYGCDVGTGSAVAAHHVAPPPLPYTTGTTASHYYVTISHHMTQAATQFEVMRHSVERLNAAMQQFSLYEWQGNVANQVYIDETHHWNNGAAHQYQQAATYAANYTANIAWSGSTAEYEPVPQTPEQIERRNRALLRRKVVAHRAERRAKKLLMRVLNDLQLHEYAKNGSFTTVAADGRIFRLRSNKTAELLGMDGKPVASYCIHLTGGYRPEDTLVAQKLLLDTDPARFEEVANVTVLRPNVEGERERAAREEVRVAMTGARSIRELRDDDGRYLAEHYRESAAILMGEGIADPEAWDEELREHVARAVRREVA